MSEQTFRTVDEAILAALDEMEEGDTLTVHEQNCLKPITDICSCEPREWTY